MHYFVVVDGMDLNDGNGEVDMLYEEQRSPPEAPELLLTPQQG